MSSSTDNFFATGPLWYLKWAVVVMLLTLVVDLFYTLWPYPQGNARGVDALRANLDQEWALLVQLGDDRYPPVAESIHSALYFALFKAPGIHYLRVGAEDPTPMQGGNLFMQKLVQSTNKYWETAAVGLQLFSIRLAVLALAIPLIALTTLGAFSDGIAEWFLRRTGGGRESGFIYHRAKRLVGHSIVAMAAFYLVPPVVLDPRWVFPPFLIAYAVAVRVTTSYFKKYV